MVPRKRKMTQHLCAKSMILLERQRKWIRIAKDEGRYKGRKATARALSDQVLELLAQGKTKQAVADELKIGVASVYRIAKAAKQ